MSNMINKMKEKYVAPTTTFDCIQGEGEILITGSGSDISGEEGEGDWARQSAEGETGFEYDSFDFGSW